ncbi:unnamed protein product [Caenorhabditis bovis]|uniref:NTF2 domain-containing protein n=1 Tax=Caenorhabditis bovis TaxID=2654633 RepID=A0A8S1F4B9_9PELO|nr:unnamed protein product [Caenorhabditis bovis]
MQLTAPINAMKMNDVMNGNPNASPSSDIVSPADAENIVNAFGRQFYTTLSNNRSDVQKFYGHQSMVKCGDKVAVGQQDIAKFYEANFDNKLHYKIHKMTGIPTLHQGILVHVFGHINLRKFTQTFILGQQCAKKYYIENDVFNFIDDVFIAEGNQPPKMNGHVKAVLKENVEKQVPVIENTAATPTKNVHKAHPTPRKIEERSPLRDQENKPAFHEKRPEPIKQQAPAPTPKKETPAPPAPAPVPQEPPKPKTWANLVGGGAKATATQHQVHTQSVQQPQQHEQPKHENLSDQQPRDTHPQTQNANRHDVGSLMERKIYLGGITRTIVPDSTATAETEIKTIFYKFGEVEGVSIPRKVLDFPNDTSKTAFAFITMRNVAAAQKVFDSATKDETGVYRLQLKIDSFGFDGLATISEQKDRPHNYQGGFRNRGGYQSRGGFNNSRGRGAGRGGPRGGFHNSGFGGQNGHH